jgi:hypothetical protein
MANKPRATRRNDRVRIAAGLINPLLLATGGSPWQPGCYGAVRLLGFFIGRRVLLPKALVIKEDQLITAAAESDPEW